MLSNKNKILIMSTISLVLLGGYFFAASNINLNIYQINKATEQERILTFSRSSGTFTYGDYASSDHIASQAATTSSGQTIYLVTKNSTYTSEYENDEISCFQNGDYNGNSEKPVRFCLDSTGNNEFEFKNISSIKVTYKSGSAKLSYSADGSSWSNTDATADTEVDISGSKYVRLYRTSLSGSAKITSLTITYVC